MVTHSRSHPHSCHLAFDRGCGERLSFGTTMLLIIVTQSMVASSFLPVCSEILWYVNWQWAAFGRYSPDHYLILKLGLIHWTCRQCSLQPSRWSIRWLASGFGKRLEKRHAAPMRNIFQIPYLQDSLWCYEWERNKNGHSNHDDMRKWRWWRQHWWDLWNVSC